MKSENALSRLFAGLTGKKAPSLSDKDRLAALIGTDPNAFTAFERAYQTAVLDADPGQGVFDTNSRQASAQTRAVDPENRPRITERDISAAKAMAETIAASLAAETPVYAFDGYTERLPEAPDFTRPMLPAPTGITNKDIAALHPAVRPQLTDELMKRDVSADTGMELLSLYAESMNPDVPVTQRRLAYHQFRQGLDILDLDGLTYAMLGMNQNAMSHWLPALVKANQNKSFFKIPATKIAQVPITLLQLSRTDYELLTQTSKDIVDLWAMKVFGLDENKSYFIKTGTYSSKFDFRNVKVTTPKEVRELGEYLLYIQYQAGMMAGPLTQPSIYGASTTNEWVVREFIEDKENNPTIYKGLPLHTEYRVFIDCDRKLVLGVTPYWEPETMKKRFAHEPDADSPHQVHDYVVYKSHEHVLINRYNNNKADVVQAVAELLPDLELTGQWSLDIMQNGEDFWLIDMALAETSAFYADCVPEALRRPTEENWLPHLPETAKNKENEEGEI